MRTHHISPIATESIARRIATGCALLAATLIAIITLLAPSVGAQTTSTFSPNTTSTQLGTDSTTTPPSIDTTIAGGTTDVVDTAPNDTAIPEGGVDAGFGGTMSTDKSWPVLPVAVTIGILGVSSLTVAAVARARRIR